MPCLPHTRRALSSGLSSPSYSRQLGNQQVQFGKEDDALLVACRCVSDEGCSRRTRPVHHEVGDIRRNVHVVAGHEVCMVFQPRPEEHFKATVDDVDCRFDGSVEMSPSTGAVWQNQHRHGDGLRPNRLTGEAAQVGEALFALVSLARSDYGAGAGPGGERPLVPRRNPP